MVGESGDHARVRAGPEFYTYASAEEPDVVDPIVVKFHSVT
jgi:hypothetical protein